MENDPLFIKDKYIAPTFPTVNRRGRPCNHETIRFRSPPRSIVCQQLREERKYSISCKKSQKDCDATVSKLFENNTVREYVYVEDGNLENDLESCKHKDKEESDRDNINVGENTSFAHCDTSSFSSQQSEELIDHNSVHKEVNKYTCDFKDCTYNTNISSNLTKHKRKHTNEKPYLCELCSFKSSYISSLKVHRRIHTSERPYCCEHCGYKCNSSSNLKKHVGYKHAVLHSTKNNT